MSASNLTNTLLLPPPLLRLPLELRLQIYRHLLLSARTVRMTLLNYRTTTTNKKNSSRTHLHPAILRTCRLFHNEATNILYRENIFRAHRIDDLNPHAAMITRAKCVIGLVNPASARDDLAHLAALLGGRFTGLRQLIIEIGSNLEHDERVRCEIQNAVLYSTWYYRSTFLASRKKRRGLGDNHDDCVMREGEEKEGKGVGKTIDSSKCTGGVDCTIEFSSFRAKTKNVRFSLHGLAEWKEERGGIKSTSEPNEDKDEETTNGLTIWRQDSQQGMKHGICWLGAWEDLGIRFA